MTAGSARAEAAGRLTEALAHRGFGVVPGFLSGSETAALRARLAELDAAGRFRAAAVGAGANRAVRRGVRGDRLCWLDPPLAPAEAALLDETEALRERLNAGLGLGLFDFECQYAIYAPGAVYVRHLDRSPAGAERVISVVIYLNEGWLAAEGGALRLYTGADAVEVLPEGGTLVAFESARFEHEVCQAVRDRLSIAGWFRRRAQLPGSR